MDLYMDLPIMISHHVCLCTSYLSPTAFSYWHYVWRCKKRRKKITRACMQPHKSGSFSPPCINLVYVSLCWANRHILTCFVGGKYSGKYVILLGNISEHGDIDWNRYLRGWAISRSRWLTRLWLSKQIYKSNAFHTTTRDHACHVITSHTVCTRC